MAHVEGKDRSEGIDERRRVLKHASSLNRADVIKKVVSCPSPLKNTTPIGGSSVAAGTGGEGCVDREVLNHMYEDGLTALHHAVKKCSLDVSFGVVVTLVSLERS